MADGSQKNREIFEQAVGCATRAVSGDSALEVRFTADVPGLAEGEAMRSLNDLLQYRREVNSTSEWPFDVGALSRLALYLIIPPLTWVGAALIENLVDSAL